MYIYVQLILDSTYYDHTLKRLISSRAPVYCLYLCLTTTSQSFTINYLLYILAFLLLQAVLYIPLFFSFFCLCQ